MLKFKSYQQYLKWYLKTTYEVPNIILSRYTKLLIERAVEFYIDKHLDTLTVQGDLWNDDDEYYPNLKYEEDKNKEKLERII